MFKGLAVVTSYEGRLAFEYMDEKGKGGDNIF